MHRMVDGDHGKIMVSGVRNRNNAPCANSMKIAGQRDTEWFVAAAPELIGRQHRYRQSVVRMRAVCGASMKITTKRSLSAN